MKRYTFYFILLTLTSAPFLSGCGKEAGPGTKAPPAEEAAGDEHAAGEEHAEGEEHEDEAGEVTLTAEQQTQAAIQTVLVRTEALTTPISVPARIVPSETGQAVAGAVVSGRVVRLLAAEGQAVQRGQPLAIVESQDVSELQGELLHTRATVERTRQEYERQRQLFAEGLSAERLLEQAREEYRIAQADEASLEARLRGLGGTPASGPDAVNGQVAVRAPISGVISNREATLGDFVEPSLKLYEIIAPGSVYADAEVPPEQAAGLRPGLGAVITGPGETKYRGEIASIAPDVEAETRTARIRVRVLNATAALRPETFVTVEFAGEGGRRALVVPAAAIERAGQEAFVYKTADEPNTYARVPVELGAAAGDVVEVRGGLAAGDRVVVNGTFYLRSLRQKGELSEHEH